MGGRIKSGHDDDLRGLGNGGQGRIFGHGLALWMWREWDMGFVDDYAPLLIRVLLVVLFPFSAADKIVHWGAVLRGAGALPFKPVLIGASVVVELVAPVCIVTGWHDRLAAGVLTGFCVVTAVLYHQFWRYPEFWRFEEGVGLSHFWDFLKNFGLVGGLCLIVLSPRTLPVSEAARHPLASTQVIGPAAGAPR